jgi:hypothetical protein
VGFSTVFALSCAAEIIILFILKLLVSLGFIGMILVDERLNFDFSKGLVCSLNVLLCFFNFCFFFLFDSSKTVLAD